MSSLSGIGTSDQSSLYALLQRLNQSTSTSDTSQSTSAAPQSPQQFLTSELEKQGYSGSTLSDLLNKIQSTVDSLKNSSTGPVDPSSIHDAINKVLKDAGVNTDQIDKDFQTQRPHGHHGHHGSAGASSTDSASSSQNSTTSTDTLLSELGVDPKKFQAALQNALLNTNADGSIDLSKLFASAGTGSQLNLLA